MDITPSTRTPPAASRSSHCSNGVKWLKDHPYISVGLYFVSLAALGVLLAYVDLSLSHKLIIGCVTGSLLTLTFVPFGCLCQVKNPKNVVHLTSPQSSKILNSPGSTKSALGRLSHEKTLNLTKPGTL